MQKRCPIVKVCVLKNPEELGKAAAAFSAGILNQAIAAKGKARLVLSTGASQFDTIKALIKMSVDWSKVEMFHLDEYVNLPETHPASFRKYLKERFTSQINLLKAHFVNGEKDVAQNLAVLTAEIRKEPIDLALIGIGENAHIAFNDPPADFNTTDAYIVVNLNAECKKQQVGEGWFATVEDVPKQAISMTVHQIMQSKVIVSAVPYSVKAKAIQKTLSSEVTNMVPATKLKEHPNVIVYIDEDSASLTDKKLLSKFL